MNQFKRKALSALTDAQVTMDGRDAIATAAVYALLALVEELNELNSTARRMLRGR